MQHALCAPQLTGYGFAHGFSTRPTRTGALNLGSSDVGLAAFAAEVGYEPARLFTVTQVHGAMVRVLTPQDNAAAGSVQRESADALLLPHGAPHVAAAIAVRTADCVPLLLADPETRAVAAVHAGWRGLVAGVIAASVRVLCEVSGAPVSRLVAASFPHIGPCCFEVGAEVAGQLLAAAPGADASAVVRHQYDKPHVSLAHVATAQLSAAGIDPLRHEQVAGCTFCDAARFHSYRRDGKAAGRHMTVIIGG